MNLFLDTSVLLAAAGSASGASREIFRRRRENQWVLDTTQFVVDEVEKNIHKLQPSAMTEWESILPTLIVRENVLTLDRIVVFGPGKDRPILFSALAYSSVLLTLDREDFGGLMNKPFYGLLIQKPGTFLEHQRMLGKLK